MAKCDWNVVKLKNSKLHGGGKRQDFFLWIGKEIKIVILEVDHLHNELGDERLVALMFF
jgi:hypothetical protein